MERLTKEIVLPDSKAKVTLYTFLVNGDYKFMEEELVKMIKPDFSQIDKTLPEEEQQKLRTAAIEKASNEVTGSVYLLQKRMVAKLLVKGVEREDGTSENKIDDFIYNLSKKDGEFLDKAVEQIDADSALTEDQKKNSQETQ